LNKHPKIIVSVTSDLSTDQRVHRSCLALQKQGFEVLLVGRALPGSPPVPVRSYPTKRFRLLFHEGPLFYAAYNIRLFFFLLFSRANALFSNDLDTLPANFLVSKIRGQYLIYDSHEYYTGVPELQHRPWVRGTWKMMERIMFPKILTTITVNDSIASLFAAEYGNRPVVIRNVPIKPAIRYHDIPKKELRLRLGLPEEKRIVILQGSGININRGAEEALSAMEFLEGTLLLILGGGDVVPVLRQMAESHRLLEKVRFLPRMPYDEMMQYTAAADAGLTLDKDTNINYRYSLPNKIFDYIHAGIPVLASRLPEVERIVTGYDVGMLIDTHDPRHIADRINEMFSDPSRVARWKKNLQIAASELNWEEEEKKFPVIPHGRS
jgi:glycosyltransferase involved in cell wall biosynthesis